MDSDSESGIGKSTAFVKKLCGSSTPESTTAETLLTVLNLNATQHTASNYHDVSPLKHSSDNAKNSFSVINKGVDTDFNVEAAQEMQKDYDQAPSPVYPGEEADEKTFTSQSKAVIQHSKLVPDTHVLNSDFSVMGKNL